MEDRKIIELFFDRDEQAIQETDKKYGRYCLSIAHNILNNTQDAEETVNDVYIGTWNAIPPHCPENLSAFLGKITRRYAIKRWRAARALKRGGGEVPLVLEELMGCIPAGSDMERDMEMADLNNLLNRFIASLPKQERTVFVCRYWYMDPVGSIANRYGYSQSKVKSMLSRTRSKLRIYLKKEDYDL